MKTFFFLCLVIIVERIDGHGRLTVPETRVTKSPGGINAPVYTCVGSVFGSSKTSMRCHDSEEFTTLTPLVVGKTMKVQWTLTANHPGDCSLWLSYDVDKKSPQYWIKLRDFPGCLSKTGVNPPYEGNVEDIILPNDIPDCEHCVLRWEWYGVHQVSNVEFYANCADVSISGGNQKCPIPTSVIEINNIEHFGSSCPFYNVYDGGVWTEKKIQDRVRGPKPWMRNLDIPCGNESSSLPMKKEEEEKEDNNIILIILSIIFGLISIVSVIVIIILIILMKKKE